MHLQTYCNRHSLDIAMFGKPKIIRGRVAHYEYDRNRRLHMVYGPSWDFYYTYRGEPAITVLISYDEMRGVTELIDAMQPGEKPPTK